MAAAAGRPPAVVLVGFMGAGKSAVGRALAALLGVPFLDTDDVLAAQAGPIPAIFAERGEGTFRELEAAIVTEEVAALSREPKVLALGGGAVLSDEVRRSLAAVPHVVWLTAPADELWRRVAAGMPDERPLARDESSFRALLAARENLYREVAGVAIETQGRDADAVAVELASLLEAAAPVPSGEDGGEGST